MKISAVVISKNEESRIKACLESIKWVDEIIIIDSGSTDKTLSIAKKYADKIFNEKNEDFSYRRNLGMQRSSGEWVLYVDADERVLASLKEEIKKLILDDTNTAYAIPRKNIIFGEEVNYGPYKHDFVIRLIKRDSFDTWIGNVHEYPKFRGKLGYTKNYLLHLTHRDVDQFVNKSLRWSVIGAKLRFDAHHPKMTKWRFFRIIFSETYNQGIKRRGFFGGTVGVIDSILQVFSLYITYVRLWQMQQTDIERRYDQIDKNLIKYNFQNEDRFV